MKPESNIEATRSVPVPRFCPVCGKFLHDRYQPAHPVCCLGVFGIDSVPELHLPQDWNEYTYPGSHSFHLLPLRLIVRRRILVPSSDEYTGLLLKIPMLKCQKSANRLVETEWLTMLLARKFGLPTLRGASVTYEKDHVGYLLPRIDKRPPPHGMKALHIETLAQTYRRTEDFISASLSDRGSSIIRISSCPKSDSIDFLLRVIFSFLFFVPACDPRKLMFMETNTYEGMRLAPAYGLRSTFDDETDAMGDYGEVFLNRSTYLSLCSTLSLNEEIAESLLQTVLANKWKTLRILKTVHLRELHAERMPFIETVNAQYNALNSLV